MWFVMKVLAWCCVVATLMDSILMSPTPIQSLADAEEEEDQNFHTPGHRRLRQARIESIKQEILNKLGLSKVPDVKGMNVTAAEKRLLMKRYTMSLEEIHGKSHVIYDDDQLQAKTFHSFTEHVTHHQQVHSQRSRRLYFEVDIPDTVDPKRETTVSSATLKLYRNYVPMTTIWNHSDNAIQINLYQTTQSLTGNEVTSDRRIVTSKLVVLDKAGWVEFDVAEVVGGWLQNRDSNFGLEISVDDPRFTGHLEALGFTFRDRQQRTDNPHESNHNHHHRELWPLLNVITKEKSILGRLKRDVSEEKVDCTSGDGETRCCRYSLWISFAEIGWGDWVVAPPGYQAHYCFGTCAPRTRIAHNYAGIRSIVNMLNPLAAPAPVCAATRLGPLSIGHYLDGRLEVSIFNDMVVQECMCV